jgi:hypothetical protein
MFHINCINQSINANYLSCPECRDPINNVDSIKNIDKSLRIAIYNEAYDNGFVEPCGKTANNKIIYYAL